MQMRKCANCGERYPINEPRCPECATHAPASKGKKRADPICSYEVNGQRCRYPGTMSSGTLGDGPWFCRWHYDCTSPVVGEEVILQSLRADHSRSAVDQSLANYTARTRIPERIRKMSVAECQAEIKRLLPSIGGRAPGSDWAVRIMDRIAKGEKLPIISEQRAREALGLSAEREPGEDFGQDDDEREVAA